jgi:hypothetical protein
MSDGTAAIFSGSPTMLASVGSTSWWWTVNGMDPMKMSAGRSLIQTAHHLPSCAGSEAGCP